jgi:hypothetical protein
VRVCVCVCVCVCACAECVCVCMCYASACAYVFSCARKFAYSLQDSLSVIMCVRMCDSVCSCEWYVMCTDMFVVHASVVT